MSVAVIAPPEVTVIVPFTVSKSVNIIESLSSKVITPVPLTLMFALATVVSKSIPTVASAVNTSAVTSSLSSVPSWVIAPVPAFKVTSPEVPALIRETAMPFQLD